MLMMLYSRKRCEFWNELGYTWNLSNSRETSNRKPSGTPATARMPAAVWMQATTVRQVTTVRQQQATLRMTAISLPITIVKPGCMPDLIASICVGVNLIALNLA